MASKNNINSVFTDIANSIRAKKGTTNTIQPINMAEEIDGIPTGITPSGKIEITNTEEINVTNYATAQVVANSLIPENIKKGEIVLGVPGTYEGDTTQEDGLITGEITSYTNDRVTRIRYYAFYNFNNLITIDLPNVTSIDMYALSLCNNLINVNLPKATSIGSNAFNQSTKIKSMSLPNATSIGSRAFYSCYSLISIDLPKVTNIDSGAFYRCSNLTNVNIPKLTSIAIEMFGECSNLKNLNIPNITSIGSYAFSSCYSLLKLVITQTDSVCTLSNTNAFNSCYHFLGTVNSTYNPEGLKDGRIYVPDSLVDSYKSATNWSAYADIIVPLSTLVE